MIDTALIFLRKYIEKRFQNTIGAPAVTVSDLPKDATDIDGDKIHLTLINVEEDKIFKNVPTYQTVSADNTRRVMNPEIRLNLFLLISAVFKRDSTNGYYERQLKYLSQVVLFFQGKNVFDQADFTAVDYGMELEKLHVELQSTTLDQNNQIWQSLGGKMYPSVYYKIRLVALVDKQAEPIRTASIVTDIEIQLKVNS